MTGSSRVSRSRIYDGGIYAHLVDPFLEHLRRTIVDSVDSKGSVLDVGCGTGSLVLALAAKAKSVVGIELSPKMVAYGRRRLKHAGLSNLTVIEGDVTETLKKKADGTFETATMVLVLHELPPDTRGQVLREVVRLARRVLCLDYSVPRPCNMIGLSTRLVEMATGSQHYKAYCDFVNRGGISEIARESGLSSRKLQLIHCDAFELVELYRA